MSGVISLFQQFKNGQPKAAALLVYAFIVLPPLMGFWFVHMFGVDVVWYDHFAVADLLRTSAERPLDFGDFFAQHNEHRILFPKLTLYLIARLSGFNNFWEMYFVEICLLLIMLIYLREYSRTEGCKSLLYFFPVAFMTFSPVQYVNMLWGFQLAIIYALLFSALSFHLLTSYARSQRSSHLALAAVTGLVASFSNASGLFVWPAGLIALATAGNGKRRSLPAAVWAAIGAGAWSLYFRGFAQPSQHPPLLHFLAHPFEVITFMAGGLGGWASASSTPDLVLALIVGSVLILLLAAVSFIIAKRRLLAKYSFWVSLSAFSLMTFFSIAIGRAGFGAGLATDSRYTTFSLPLVISLYIMSVSLMASRYPEKLLRVAQGGFLVLFSFVYVPCTVYTGVQSAELLKYERKILRAILLNFDRLPEKAISSSLFPDKTFLVENAAFLKANKLNAFSGEPEGGVVFALDDSYFVVESIGDSKALPGNKISMNRGGSDVHIRGTIARKTEMADAKIGLALGGTPVGYSFVEQRFRQILIGGTAYNTYSFTASTAAVTVARGSYKLRAALKGEGGSLSYSNEYIDIEVE